MRFICDANGPGFDLTFTECNGQGKLEIERLLLDKQNLQVSSFYISRLNALALARALIDFGNLPIPEDM